MTDLSHKELALKHLAEKHEIDLYLRIGDIVGFCTDDTNHGIWLLYDMVWAPCPMGSISSGVGLKLWNLRENRTQDGLMTKYDNGSWQVISRASE